MCALPHETTRTDGSAKAPQSYAGRRKGQVNFHLQIRPNPKWDGQFQRLAAQPAGSKSIKFLSSVDVYIALGLCRG